MPSFSNLPSYTIPVLTFSTLLAVGVLIFVLFSKNPSGLTIEILAAIIAVVLVVASVCITVHYQQVSDTQREFNVHLFERKLDLYTKFIETVTQADDDQHVTPDEMMAILNVAREVSLVGKSDLVESIADFIEGVVDEKSVLVRADSKNQRFSDVVQNMRDDLAVVDDGQEDATGTIRQLMQLAPKIHEVENGTSA